MNEKGNVDGVGKGIRRKGEGVSSEREQSEIKHFDTCITVTILVNDIEYSSTGLSGVMLCLENNDTGDRNSLDKLFKVVGRYLNMITSEIDSDPKRTFRESALPTLLPPLSRPDVKMSRTMYPSLFPPLPPPPTPIILLMGECFLMLFSGLEDVYVVVEVRVVFLKIGEIDTLKEFYQADAFLQTKWREPKLDSKPPEELGTVDLERYWNPLCYIDNILSETKEVQWLSTTVGQGGEVYIIERRRIKGVFLETLELNDFPLDVQDLTITVTTERPDTEVDLIPDHNEMSAINKQTFVDQQVLLSKSMKSHPCLSVTCRAARRPGYFYWNVFLIMFMISGLSFATFAVSPDKAELRLRLSFTLILTSVTFKYVITQSLPRISYLTYMAIFHKNAT
ncbi:hypothetical protein ACTXT7_008664 [Hymenolepis weldensis]